MAYSKIMAHSRVSVCVSSSISNFSDKIKTRIDYEGDYTLFIGLYHVGDYVRFILTRGKKKLLWAGSDILNLTKFWAWIITRFKAEHIVENHIEQEALQELGIEPRVQPVILTNPDKYPESYVPNKYPHVYINCHEGRLKEYGMETIVRIAPKVPEITFHIYGIDSYDPFLPPNIRFHGKLTEEEFDERIKGFQAGLCLNKFAGFSEIVAKSVLMAQYPISRISFPHIDTCRDDSELVYLLKLLKHKKKPNYKAREWWLNQLKKPI